jgi:hypothetical protein
MEDARSQTTQITTSFVFDCSTQNQQEVTLVLYLNQRVYPDKFAREVSKLVFKLSVLKTKKSQNW